MCSLKFTKSLLPFAITFAVGLLVASVFYGLTTTKKSTNIYRSTPKVNKMKTHCNAYRSNVKKNIVADKDFLYGENSFSDSDLEVEFETTVFPPTPPETIILTEELRKNKDK